MKCLPVEKIPEEDMWTYELQLDGRQIRPSFSSHGLLALLLQCNWMLVHLQPFWRDP